MRHRKNNSLMNYHEQEDWGVDPTLMAKQVTALNSPKNLLNQAKSSQMQSPDTRGDPSSPKDKDKKKRRPFKRSVIVIKKLDGVKVPIRPF